MDLDGPVFIYRWKNALNLKADSLTWNKDLTKLVTVPFGVTKDHAEGLSLVTDAPLSIMVSYDSPSRDAHRRQQGEGGYLRDQGVKALGFRVRRRLVVKACSAVDVESSVCFQSRSRRINH